MQLSNEILKLSIMSVGSVLPIKQGDDITYLCRSTSGYAVAIPFDDERVLNESFVGITLSTNMLNYEDKSFKVLYLYMVDVGDLKKFSYIAAEFIDIENRDSIIKKPYAWVDTWNTMFGNSKKNYLISDVIAELEVLKVLYKTDKTVRWTGPKDGTHDIVFSNGVAEVKSTTNKKNNYVSINSRFQIDPSLNERLFFVRLEPKPYCDSIDSLVKEISDLGYDKQELEESLANMGYRAGNRTRKKTYYVLSMCSYKVDEDNFPVLPLDDLNNMTKTRNIVGYSLELDLSSVDHETII